MNLQPSIKRFLSGVLLGLFIAVIVWSYSAYFHSSISFTQGIIGSLFLAISFGVVATISDIDKLMDSIPFL